MKVKVSFKIDLPSLQLEEDTVYLTAFLEKLVIDHIRDIDYNFYLHGERLKAVMCPDIEYNLPD
jgi:hypothetical protein